MTEDVFYDNPLGFDEIRDCWVQCLEREFEEEEVRKVVFDMTGDKAPGPDGFPMSLFQRFWTMLKKDIMAFINEFHQRGKLSKGLGASFIVLIMKKVGEIGIRDYRPISLLGSIYKIFAKVLAGRIQMVLSVIISKEQGAFVNGMQILDDILVANECVHSRDKDRILGIIFKLDVEKAYDRVDWKFLQYTLRRMGFGEKLDSGVCFFSLGIYNDKWHS